MSKSYRDISMNDDPIDATLVEYIKVNGAEDAMRRLEQALEETGHGCQFIDSPTTGFIGSLEVAEYDSSVDYATMEEERLAKEEGAS